MGHLVGWVSSRRRRSVIFRLRCNSISSFWVSNTCTLQKCSPFFFSFFPSNTQSLIVWCYFKVRCNDLTWWWRLGLTCVSLCLSVAASCVEASRPLPDFADIDVHEQTLPDGILLEHLKAFQTLYREHCEVDSHGQDRTCTWINNTLD